MDIGFSEIPQEIIINGFCSVYYQNLSNQFEYQTQQHEFWEMVYVDVGTVTAIIDNSECVLESGQIIFHHPLEPHLHKPHCDDSSSILTAIFSCDSPGMNFFENKIFTLQRTSKKLVSLFANEAKTILGDKYFCDACLNPPEIDFANASMGSPQLMQCYLIELILSIIRDEHPLQFVVDSVPSLNSTEVSLSLRIKQYIEQNCFNFPNLKEICYKFSFSPTYITRIFKAEVNQSPIEYWNNCKIDAAKRLIISGESSITEISFQLGYNSIHHFSRMFKRKVGLSPSEFKKDSEEKQGTHP